MNGTAVGRTEGTVVDFWAPLRRSTQARIGLGRSGDGEVFSSQLLLAFAPAALGVMLLLAFGRLLLRPMLKDWLDAHLPAIVEAQVRKEVERIARSA